MTCKFSHRRYNLVPCMHLCIEAQLFARHRDCHFVMEQRAYLLGVWKKTWHQVTFLWVKWIIPLHNSFSTYFQRSFTRRFNTFTTLRVMITQTFIVYEWPHKLRSLCAFAACAYIYQSEYILQVTDCISVWTKKEHQSTERWFLE